jgi:TRAP-type C4-dicarboxylate transport system substrate-binding protein
MGLLLLLGMAVAANAEITLKQGTMYPEISNYGKAMNKFAELTDKYSGGSLKVKVYHAGLLGKKQQLIEKIQTGQTDIYIETIDVFEQFVPEAYFQSMPHLFANVAHARKFLNSEWFNQNISKKFEKRGMLIPGQDFSWERGPYRVLICKEPVMKLDDLPKIKLRVYASEMYRKSWNQLGANTTNVDWTEVYLALKQNLIQAVTAPMNLVLPMKFTEVAKYITRINEFPQIPIVYVNQNSYAKLSAEQKKALRRAYDDAGKYYTQLNYASAESDIEYMLANHGATFIRIPLPPWQEKIKPLYVEMEKEGKIAPGFFEMVQKMK